MDDSIAYVHSSEFKARQEMGICKSLVNPSVPSIHSPSPSYLSWLQPLVEPPSAEPLCEQEDFRGLGCHRDGRLLTETSIRSWGTVVGRRGRGRAMVKSLCGSQKPHPKASSSPLDQHRDRERL